jgi:hypothetical protein
VINEIELELRELDPSMLFLSDFEEKIENVHSLPNYLLNFDDKMMLFTELVKPNEIFFKPFLVGNP